MHTRSPCVNASLRIEHYLLPISIDFMQRMHQIFSFYILFLLQCAQFSSMQDVCRRASVQYLSSKAILHDLPVYESRADEADQAAHSSSSQT